ncbi:hypothetical protein AALP_AAs41867U000100, partial [Arabis alpina]
MPPKTKFKPAAAAKATAAGRLTTVAREKAAAKVRQSTGTSRGGRGGRGGGGKAAVQDIPRQGGGRLNPIRGVPSTPVPTVGVPSTSTGVPSTSTRVPSSSTGVPSSSTRVPSTSTANRRGGGGGGIPELPLLTGAASGGSTARSDRLVTPTRQPVGPGRETSGGRKSVVDGTSGTGGNHSPSSERTVSGSVSRTTQAAQFPPARLGPSASQRHSLDLNDSPPSRFQGPPLHMTREEPEEEDEQ